MGDRHIGSSAAGVPVSTASRLHEILQLDVLSDIKKRPQMANNHKKIMPNREW